MAAASAQNDPTQQWHVVVEGDAMVALGAGRARSDHRDSAWHAIDTHIQKAAKGQPEDKNRRCKNWVHAISKGALRAKVHDEREFLSRRTLSFSVLGLIICRPRRGPKVTEVTGQQANGR